MLLRDYQNEASDSTVAALAESRNALIVMPTGGGKSLVAADVLKREYEAGREHEETATGNPFRALVLQHTEELIRQNLKAVANHAGLAGSVVKAAANDWSGDCVFASTPTLARDGRLDDLPFISHIVIDEAHRAVTDGVCRVINAVRRINPAVRILGLTATPDRGDGADLSRIFTCVSHETTIGDLIERGILVYPKGFAINLQNAEFTEADLADDERIASRLNILPVNDAIFRHWQEKCLDATGGRRTLAFCATIAHAESVAARFNAGGVKAAAITTRTSASERARILAALDAGEIKVVTNCTALAEGFDCQPVSAILLLRPLLKPITFRQAIGRGLRSVDAERYPDETKTDCLVLDFVGAIERHGGLSDAFGFNRKTRAVYEAPGERNRLKACPGCETKVPAASTICPLCDHVFAVHPRPTVKSFDMIEADLMADSPFAWVEARKNWFIAAGFGGWAGFFQFDGAWHALGRTGKTRLQRLVSGTRLQAMAAAADYLRTIEDGHTVAKGRSWMQQPATARQVALFNSLGNHQDYLPPHATKYQAMCVITRQLNQKAILATLYEARRRRAAAARQAA